MHLHFKNMNPQKANKLVFFISFGIILFLLNAPLRVDDEMEMRNRQISSNIVIDTEKKGLIVAVINTPKVCSLWEYTWIIPYSIASQN